MRSVDLSDLTREQLEAAHARMQTPEFPAKAKRLHERGRKGERFDADTIVTELGVPFEIVVSAMAYLLINGTTGRAS